MKNGARGFRLTVRLLALATAALALSCFDAPVRQRLELSFRADGSVEVRAATTILSSWRHTDNPRVAARLDAMREAILDDQDLWARAVRAMAPERERVCHDFEGGVLVSSMRKALASDPRSVDRLFAPTPVSASVRQEEREITLELVPSGADQATYRQKRRIEEVTETFASSVARYLETLADLYAHLDLHPGEARAAMTSLLQIADEDEDAALSEEGRRLVERVDEAAGSLIEVLDVSEDEAYTLDELSRLVYDPFPALVTIEVDGEVLESEGFIPLGDRRFATRRHGLWDALPTLSERWVTPLPVVVLVAALREASSSEDVDEESLLESTLTAPRRVHHVPDENEVRAEILRRLRPPEYYRLRWSLPDGAD